MSQSPVLMQSHFRERYFRSECLLENINDQSQHLRLLESAVLQDDPSSIRDELSKLDFDFLRNACFFIERKITEAARTDCASLIVESVLDHSDGKVSGEHWCAWLSLAPYWPQLAEACWSTVLGDVTRLLVERLNISGVMIDRAAEQEIDVVVSSLSLGDVLPPQIMAQFFTEVKADKDGEEEG